MRSLFFEEILESLAGVVRARRRSARRAGRLRIRSGRGGFFHGRAEVVESAMVLGVFGRDAFFNWVRALELRAGIEEAALLATMQFELALGTLTIGVKARGEDRATIGTAGARDGSNHARGTRAELIGAARAAGWRLLFVRALALLTFL